MDKPIINTSLTAEDRDFLIQLRDSGETNMFGAAPYLRQKFGYTEKVSIDKLVAWMREHE